MSIKKRKKKSALFFGFLTGSARDAKRSVFSGKNQDNYMQLFVQTYSNTCAALLTRNLFCDCQAILTLVKLTAISVSGFICRATKCQKKTQNTTKQKKTANS